MTTTDPTTALARARATTRLISVVDDLAWHPDAVGRVLRGRRRADGRPCVVKIGPGAEELAWMPAVSAVSDDVVARVLGTGALAADESDAPLDWMILEDLPWRGRSDEPAIAGAVMRAAARFQQVAVDLELPTYPIDAAFARDFAHRSAVDPDCPGPAGVIADRAESDDAWVRSLDGHVKGHGDLHFWNALGATEAGPWRLVDPIPRMAHWAWDAAYAQLTSGVAATPDLIAMLAQERRRLGLPVTDPAQLSRVRTIALGWSAVMWWTLQTGRRDDRWWVAEIGRRMRDLAELD